MISLSTCWVPPGVECLSDLFETAMELGYRSFEIGVSRLPFNLAEVQKARRELGIEIASVHNVASECSNDPKNNRGDFVGYPDETRRGLGVRCLADTIRNCRAMGGRAVVVHGGCLDGVWVQEMLDEQDALADMIRLQGLDETARDLAAKMRHHRAEGIGPYLEASLKSLAEVATIAPEIILGLESRYHYYEIPSLDELGVMFEKLSGGNFGYWHDVGHAQIQELLGMCEHRDWLERYGDRLVGVHLHGMKGKRDHHPIALGGVDFKMLAKYLRPDTIKVLEFNPALAKADVADALKRLQGLGIT